MLDSVLRAVLSQKHKEDAPKAKAHEDLELLQDQEKARGDLEREEKLRKQKPEKEERVLKDDEALKLKAKAAAALEAKLHAQDKKANKEEEKLKAKAFATKATLLLDAAGRKAMARVWGSQLASLQTGAAKKEAPAVGDADQTAFEKHFVAMFGQEEEPSWLAALKKAPEGQIARKEPTRRSKEYGKCLFCGDDGLIDSYEQGGRLTAYQDEQGGFTACSAHGEGYKIQACQYKKACTGEVGRTLLLQHKKQACPACYKAVASERAFEPVSERACRAS